jgi:hypothetical protein
MRCFLWIFLISAVGYMGFVIYWLWKARKNDDNDENGAGDW